MLHNKAKVLQDNTDEYDEPLKPNEDIFQIVEEQEYMAEMEELRRMQHEIEERRRAQAAAEERERLRQEALAQKAEADRLQAIEEKRRRSYIEWFDMDVAAMLDVIVSSDLDSHMSGLIRQYQKSNAGTEPNNQEIYHIMNKIKANHLIFTRLTRNAFKHLFDKGMIFTVEAGKYLY